MLNIYVCEDREDQRKRFAAIIESYYTSNYLDATLKLSTDSPYELIKNIDTENPGLYFLDIDLKTDINGLQLAKEIKNAENRSVIVFLTAHSEMMLLTFQYKVEALDFIVKDNYKNIGERIGDCISVAYKRHLEQKPDTRVFRIAMKDTVKILEFNDIIYFETTSLKHKLRVHTDTRMLEFYSELKKVENDLDSRFMRCHKSYIINQHKIKEIDKKNSLIIMVNGDCCPCSRTAKKYLIY